jgi:alcohol dehydrogenase class IV
VAALLGAPTAEKALDELKILREALGVRPLAAFGLKPDELGAIVRDSRGGSMRFNPVELSDAELEGVLRAAME